MDPAPRPYTLVAELTHRCPLACAYCSNPLRLTARAAELDTATWRRVLREAEALGVLQLAFTGGEPLVRDDLEDLVAEARRLELYTMLITSGVPLARSRLVRLRAAGLDAVQLSFQDVDAAGAAAIAGRAADREKRAVARWLAELAVPLTLNVVLHRGNVTRTGELIALAEELGAARLELANVQYLGWAFRNRAALMPDADALAAARGVAGAAALRLRGRMEVLFVVPDHRAELPRPCMDGWGRRFVVVAPDGTVLPCHAAASLPGLAFANVRTRPLAAAWRAPGMEAFRGEAWMPESCRSCARRALDFGGCRCRAYALTGNVAAVDPVCRHAPDHAALVAARTAAAARREPPPLRLRRLDAEARP